jgi:hypothetical protein
VVVCGVALSFGSGPDCQVDASAIVGHASFLKSVTGPHGIPCILEYKHDAGPVPRDVPKVQIRRHRARALMGIHGLYCGELRSIFRV